MGWNLRLISSCHPECGLTVTTKPLWGGCEPKQLLKLHKWDRVAAHRSGLHIVDISPFQTHKRCSFFGLADAPPLPVSSRAQCIGGMQGGSFPPCSLPYPDPVFPSAAESIGDKDGGSHLWDVTLQQHRHRAQVSASRLALLLLQQERDLCFSGSLICFIQGNHSKCTVPSPDPTEFSDTAPVDLDGTGI